MRDKETSQSTQTDDAGIPFMLDRPLSRPVGSDVMRKDYPYCTGLQETDMRDVSAIRQRARNMVMMYVNDLRFVPVIEYPSGRVSPYGVTVFASRVAM